MTFDDIDGHMAIDFVRNGFRFVDEQIVALEKLIKQDMQQEGDSWFFGYADYFAGIGFVAGQRYITSVCGLFKLRKREALTLGPEFVPEISYANLINASANYWKHSDEWNFEKLNDLQEATRTVIESAGVTVGATEFVAYNMFYRLKLPGFKELIPVLTTWSNAVSESVG